MSLPRLSIIVPVFNEANLIPPFVSTLSRQDFAEEFELIFVDGGSDDQTVSNINTTNFGKLAVRCFHSAKGRAKQMNVGAQHAKAKYVLFLHVDSLFIHTSALITALQELEKSIQQTPMAGHFPLSFNRQDDLHARAYYFYESKTYLNRMDCINGDQGFLLAKDYFLALGRFDESDVYMEDARLARKIQQQEAWMCFSPILTTSARRFHLEGLAQRQLLNAIICNMDRIGLRRFIPMAANAYREQDRAGKLVLLEFFVLAHHLALSEGWICAIKYWWKTGAYVAENVWQTCFLLDCLRNRRRGFGPGQGSESFLSFYDKFISPLIRSRPGVMLIGLATLGWFYTSLLYLKLKPWAIYAFAKRP